MRIITFLLLLTLSIPALAQDSTKRYTFKEIGWTITLPDGFTEMDQDENRKKIEKGKKIMEESNDIGVDVSKLKTLFSATKSPSEYFTATITPYVPEKDGDYAKGIKKVKELTYNTFKNQMPNVELDSFSLKMTIDGLTFDKFNVILKVKDLNLTLVFISKLYKGYDFGISYLYLDEETREQVEAAIRNSKFRK